ncbi:MAG: hypothetical protein K2X41_04025 [Hyphomicrobium sp.]|nr:hypothetical protein [Hyphomicrobium sp.]
MAASGAVTSSKRRATRKIKAKAEPKVAAAKTGPRKPPKKSAGAALKIKVAEPVEPAPPVHVEAPAPDAIPTAASKKTKPARSKPSAKPKALVQRVYNTIDLELTKLEQQKGVSSQDRERASRALSQMVNSLEKAIDMQREMIKSAAPRNSVKDTEALRHAEDLRREIAERLERLNGGRKPRRRAGAAE